MWHELKSRLERSAYSTRIDAVMLDTAQHLLDSLHERHPALALHLYKIATDAHGQALWRGILASDFIRHALLAEASFARDALEQAEGLPGDPDASLTALIDAHGVASGLRRHRRQQMLMIALLDIAGMLTLDEVLLALSALADRCLVEALRAARLRMHTRYGELRDGGGEPIALYAICMGKLGGNELNFSSDIDLIFCYGRDGESDGPKALAASEYALREARHVIELIDAPGEEGRVFRVDTRLRPFGEAGPLAVSLASLENYLQEHGRDWERYAFVKARFVGAAGAREDGLAGEVATFRHEVLLPFVYRRYLDFGVLSSLRDMKQMIQSEVARRDMSDHLKLGPGGIREVEFIAQSWQLIRGGMVSQLRTASLPAALDAAVEAGCFSSDAGDELLQAYRMLRVTENRLQALADRQTHRLPVGDAERDALVIAMHAHDWPALMSALDDHRRRVGAHFAALLFQDDEDGDEAGHLVWLDLSGEALQHALSEQGVDDVDGVSAALSAFHERIKRMPLEGIARDRLDQFIDGLMHRLASFDDTATLAGRVLEVAGAVLRRSAYLSLLNEQPEALQRLLQLCAASAYLSRQIADYPMLLDELLDPRLFSEPLRKDALLHELETLLAERRPDDVEAHMQALVHFARTVWFRIAVADCSGQIPIMQVSDRLSAVAEIILEQTLAIAWDGLASRHGCPAGCSAGRMQFAIVAYGKLGGYELGYGSDLDIVFLHDLPEGETDGDKPLVNSVFVTRLATRVVHLLGVQTGHGHLFEVDTRLRPSGRSGLLVSTLAAFRRYQESDAWTWEHQALSRARPVAGDREVCTSFDAIRRDVLTTNVRRDDLAGQVLSMRSRMRRELSKAAAGQFDIKQDAGGITDIEFLVQYLVLANANDTPALLDWTDNIRQLDSLAACGLLDATTAGALQDAYRAFRERVHRLSLDRLPALIGDTEFEAARHAVREAWAATFADEVAEKDADSGAQLL